LLVVFVVNRNLKSEPDVNESKPLKEHQDSTMDKHGVVVYILLRAEMRRLSPVFQE
jgi:hypothetical protein